MAGGCATRAARGRVSRSPSFGEFSHAIETTSRSELSGLAGPADAPATATSTTTSDARLRRRVIEEKYMTSFAGTADVVYT